MRLALLGLLSLAWLAGCNPGEVRGSGNRSSDVRKPGLFSEIELVGAYSAEVKLDRKDHQVTIEADDNLLPLIVTEADGAKLRVSTRKPLSSKGPLHLVVEAPDIKHLSIDGAAKASIAGLDNARLQIDIRGAGTVTAKGITQKLKVFITGAGEAALETLAAKEAMVGIQGAGTVDLASPEHLEVVLEGAGKVTYSGSPVIEQDIRGVGTLVKR
jgi:hypothetical protein